MNEYTKVSNNHVFCTQNGKKQTIGMAYVPMQVWRNLLPNDIGFQKGTIFQELDKPFQR